MCCCSLSPGMFISTLLIARADSDARYDPSAEQGKFLLVGRAMSLLLRVPVQTCSEGSSHKRLYLSLQFNLLP